MIKTMYAILNSANNEGVLFESLEDAKHATGTKKMRNFYSSLADYFNEQYGDEGKLKIHKVQIEVK